MSSPTPYNPGIMCRWPIVILTLHFLASVILFASGQRMTDIPELATWAVSSADQNTTASARQSPDPQRTAPAHGLIDEHPDLPDTVETLVIQVKLELAPALPNAPPLLPPESPWLAALQRPPCALVSA